MKREHFEGDSVAFYDEVFKRLREAKNREDRRTVLEKAFMAVRSRTFADTAFLLSEEGAQDKRVPREKVFPLVQMFQMFAPEMKWQAFIDHLLPKEGPFLEWLKKAAKDAGPSKL